MFVPTNRGESLQIPDKEVPFAPVGVTLGKGYYLEPREPGTRRREEWCADRGQFQFKVFGGICYYSGDTVAWGFKNWNLEVSEMASAKTAPAIDVRIDDVGSILKFRIGFPFGKNSAGFCKSVWLLGSILNFRIGSLSSIGGLIAPDPVCRHHFRFSENHS